MSGTFNVFETSSHAVNRHPKQTLHNAWLPVRRWVANLSTHPASSSPQDRHATITRWLMHTPLRESERLDRHRASCVSQGTYLLDGAIGRSKLARRHHPASGDTVTKLLHVSPKCLISKEQKLASPAQNATVAKLLTNRSKVTSIDNAFMVGAFVLWLKKSALRSRLDA